MLGLATHEPHFHVLREDVFAQEAKARTCRLCGQKGHIAEECQGKPMERDGYLDEKDKASTRKPFIWLHVSVLREYLAAELHVPDQPFPFDLERALDDWVCMCFFVGNDFLPHLPSLDIRENGIDTLIAIWRDNLPYMGGYLTKDGELNLGRCQFILNGLSRQEDAIFKRRKQIEERKEANAKRRKLEDESRTSRRSSSRRSPDYTSPTASGPNHQSSLPLFAPSKGEVPEDVKKMTHEMAVNRGAAFRADLANKSAAAALKSQLMGQSHDEGDDGAVQSHSSSPNVIQSIARNGTSALRKRKADLLEEEESSTPGRSTPNEASSSGSANKSADNDPPPDTVRLWESGYADRYYEQKFGADPKDVLFRNKVASAYVEGLAWVLLYYYQGCPSWRWYYPYHYAPFAADFVNLERMSIRFEKAAPLKPYEQLMGVLPAASNQAIPQAFRSLMEDESSEIIDFYPEDFHVDLNGKKWAWQGVAILPFIDEKRLLDAMAKRYPMLTKDEHSRNEKGNPTLIFSDQHSMFTDVASNFYSKRQGAPKFKLDPKKSEGLAGKIEKHPDYLPQSSLVFPLTQGVMPNLDDDHSMSVHYEIPESHHVHKSMLLNGVRLPTPTLNRGDIEATKGRAGRSGRSHGGAPMRNSSRGGRGGSTYYAESRSNPFASHLDPSFQPASFVGSGWRPSAEQNRRFNSQYTNGFVNDRPDRSRDDGYHRSTSGVNFRGGHPGDHRGRGNSHWQGQEPHRQQNGYGAGTASGGNRRYQ